MNKRFLMACRVLAFVLVSGNGLAAAVADIQPAGYAVATAHPLATRAGIEILEQGGNAFDAAVAVSAALAVVEPYHSGLGGGGFWLLHEAKTQENIVIDGRERAPLAATRDMFLDNKGQPVPALALNGGLAAAIPGEPAALALISQRFGRLPLDKTLAPAIRLAEEGFLVDDHLYYFLTMGDRAQQLNHYPASAAIFLQKGAPLKPGERLIQRDLGATLRLFAKEGHDGFYKGRVARQLVDAVRQAGGIWTLNDLATYQAKIRLPLEGVFHDMRVITVPLPSAGGVSLLTMLGILSEYPLQTLPQASWVHYVVEAMRMAYWQRVEMMGDPEFVEVPVVRLLSSENLKFLRTWIHPDKATPSKNLSEKDEKLPHVNTTHFSILDQEGNRVAATLTVNYIFGSSVVAEGTGVLLNDAMDDFSIKSGVSNVFGVMGSESNRIEPGKRPVSSMAPTFLEMPERVAILGTPGGSRIPSMVLLAALRFHEYQGALSMVSTMRFHHQYLPDSLVFEPDAFSPMLKDELTVMGYHLQALSRHYGDMQAITWDKSRQIITAASDPRHIGLAVHKMFDHQGGYGVTH